MEQAAGEGDMALTYQFRTQASFLSLPLILGRLTLSLAFSYLLWCPWAISPQSSPLEA